MSKKKDPCKGCSCMNEYGYCDLPFSDRWYACPIESEKPENKKALEEMAREGKNANSGN